MSEITKTQLATTFTSAKHNKFNHLFAQLTTDINAGITNNAMKTVTAVKNKVDRMATAYNFMTEVIITDLKAEESRNRTITNSLIDQIRSLDERIESLEQEHDELKEKVKKKIRSAYK